MIFASDTWAGVSDKVMAALAAASRHGGPAYGGDQITRRVEARFNELFEREVTVFLVGTGTAANTLALAMCARPGGVILCHSEAHILVDEAGASEALGSRVLGIEGRHGKIAPEAIAAALERFQPDHVHTGQPVAVSITEVTELGAAYSPAEIAAIAAVAHGRGLPLHVDGARFAGALAALNVSPADLTWRAGVDMMSFGATKNGCLASEAVVFFDRARAADFVFARQRAGHGFSKAWFLAAQMEAYLADSLWLDNAHHANAMAARLADVIRKSGTARLALEPAANEVFVILPQALDGHLRAAGVVYGPWSAASFPPAERPRAGEVLVRMVTTFATTAAEIDRFAAVLRGG